MRKQQFVAFTIPVDKKVNPTLLAATIDDTDPYFDTVKLRVLIEVDEIKKPDILTLEDFKILEHKMCN